MICANFKEMMHNFRRVTDYNLTEHDFQQHSKLRQMSPAREEARKISIKVWDGPLRTFHWLLASLIVVMLASAKLENFDVHIATGKILVILLLARIVWGFVGSSNARLSALVFKPGDYINYISRLPLRKPSYSLAHSPIGALAVIAILVTVSVQLTSGLFAADVDGLLEGPFAYYVTYELSRFASDIHVTNVKWLIALIVLHIIANLFYYFYKRDNLIKPMITGFRAIPEENAPHAPQLASPWRGLWVAIVVAAVMTGLYVQYG